MMRQHSVMSKRTQFKGEVGALELDAEMHIGEGAAR